MKAKNYIITKLIEVMRKLIIFIFLLASFNNLSAQSDEQIINEIFFDLFDRQEWVKDTIYIEEGKIKTSFYKDFDSYEYINGFAIPHSIISEWKKNEETQAFFSKWNEQYLNRKDTSFVENDTIIGKKPIFKSLSEYEMTQILDRNQKLFNSNRQQFYENQEIIYSIGRIIFDNSKETAIFSFLGSSRSEFAWGHNVLIKKVFGKWIIITKFDFWMT
ncbi:MAG: hypothetical protein FWC41_05820 [Firmicutes bacterium]|nr:hypothetical protein [Bacillota bacterium]